MLFLQKIWDENVPKSDILQISMSAEYHTMYVATVLVKTFLADLPAIVSMVLKVLC